MKSELTKGRRKLKSRYTEVNENNILEILSEIQGDYLLNQSEIKMLRNFTLGQQPILQRVKKVRDDINNKIVVNHADYIVDFKTTLFTTSPVQYIAKSENNNFELLETLMSLSNKHFEDKKLVNDIYTCGVGYRYVNSRTSNFERDQYDVPFEITTLESEYTAVVYSPEVVEKVLFAFTEVQKIVDGIEETVKIIYTENHVYEIVGERILSVETNGIGYVPIIEYHFDQHRRASFESVIPLINAVNLITSNRIDGIEQFIQHLMLFVNMDMTQSEIKEFQESMAIKIRRDGAIGGKDQAVELLTQELDQTQIQTLVDWAERTIYQKTNIPFNTGSESNSDTGRAVSLRDGWELAEKSIESDEVFFRKYELQFLRVCRNIIRTASLGTQDILLHELIIRMNRMSFANVHLKATIFTMLSNNQKLHPKLAFIYSNLFSDPEKAFRESEEYFLRHNVEVQNQQTEPFNTEEVI